MTKKQRALEIIERLKKEYPDAGRTISSMSFTSAEANASTVGYFPYNPSTTTLTLASVHCAASLTLTRSFRGCE